MVHGTHAPCSSRVKVISAEVEPGQQRLSPNRHVMNIKDLHPAPKQTVPGVLGKRLRATPSIRSSSEAKLAEKLDTATQSEVPVSQ